MVLQHELGEIHLREFILVLRARLAKCEDLKNVGVLLGHSKSPLCVTLALFDIHPGLLQHWSPKVYKKKRPHGNWGIHPPQYFNMSLLCYSFFMCSIYVHTYNFHKRPHLINNNLYKIAGLPSVEIERHSFA